MAFVDLLRITLPPWSVLRNLSEIINKKLGRKVSSATWGQPGDGGDQNNWTS